MQQLTVSSRTNGLDLRIPLGIAAGLRLQAGDTLELVPVVDGILLKKASPENRRYHLADILDSFVPASRCAEIDFGKPQGGELW
ncbi:hypothetical protein FACS1894139_16570 [Planctomycetales bacterium]|nr:hypothetical protein FACS1894107_09920 [Planctomycetales bacterium]GHS98319.1 hypothetical protein FACS1894108_06250 [Planctomycetales bacterium]GHT07769.1 hypothetical protein FACS1894139_16570 [Planctomycetales bacterium]